MHFLKPFFIKLGYQNGNMVIWQFLKNFTVFPMSLSQFSSELDDFFHMPSQLPFPTGFRSISRNSICIIMLLLQKRTQSIKILVVVYRSCLSLWAMTTLLSLSLCSFKGNNSIGNLRTLNHSSIDPRHAQR